MFTGLITAMGHIIGLSFQNHACVLTIQVDDFLQGVVVGDSISVAGCCLTVTVCTHDSFTACLSEHTLSLTTFKDMTVGKTLNLERSLRVGQDLGGHWVTGHIDGLATCCSIEAVGGSSVIWFEVDEAQASLIAKKGSVTLDGVSLTVNEVAGCRFSVNLIPHTLSVTTLGEVRMGTRCHVEVDIMARYAARLAQHQTEGVCHA